MNNKNRDLRGMNGINISQQSRMKKSESASMLHYSNEYISYLALSSCVSHVIIFRIIEKKFTHFSFHERWTYCQYTFRHAMHMTCYFHFPIDLSQRRYPSPTRTQRTTVTTQRRAGRVSEGTFPVPIDSSSVYSTKLL